MKTFTSTLWFRNGKSVPDKKAAAGVWIVLANLELETLRTMPAPGLNGFFISQVCSVVIWIKLEFKSIEELEWFIEQDIKGNVRLNGICLHYEFSLTRPREFCNKNSFQSLGGSLACPFDVFIFRKVLSKSIWNEFDLFPFASDGICRR